ncbi:MAG: lamin tail domain-containing protein [Pseudomonadota bacterium]|nr:PEP-CTERM sorting domain-containing protein [Pseudomonadales bacterium]MDY6919698.1 lamin tail domain-containing protein [Pseudomonadota bacterium]
MKLKTLTSAATLTLVLGAAQANAAGIYITEWMYKGNGDEFIELTNLSGSAVDFSGWSYDDDSRTPGTFDLSGFGLVADGESVILTEANAADFRTDWGLDGAVRVLGGVSNNIGRSDEINIYESFNGSTFPLADVLTYSDEDFPGSIRTDEVSGNPGTLAALGANDVSAWVSSAVGDSFNSYFSISGDLGNPGQFNPVPLPAAAWLFISGLAGLFGARLGRRA